MMKIWDREMDEGTLVHFLVPCLDGENEKVNTFSLFENWRNEKANFL